MAFHPFAVLLIGTFVGCALLAGYLFLTQEWRWNWWQALLIVIGCWIGSIWLLAASMSSPKSVNKIEVSTLPPGAIAALEEAARMVEAPGWGEAQEAKLKATKLPPAKAPMPEPLPPVDWEPKSALVWEEPPEDWLRQKQAYARAVREKEKADTRSCLVWLVVFIVGCVAFAIWNR